MASSYKQCLTMLISFLKVVGKCVTVAYASKNSPSVFKHSVLACSNTVPQGCEVELEGPFFLFFPISGPGRGRRPTPSGKEGIKEHGEERLEPVLLAFLRSNQSAKSNLKRKAQQAANCGPENSHSLSYTHRPCKHA